MSSHIKELDFSWKQPVILYYRDVCLAAFLYLEHTTLHQLKMVRKHIRDHGCTPKEHGNHRKRPHNVFSLDIYQTATKFLQVRKYLQNHFRVSGDVVCTLHSKCRCFGMKLFFHFSGLLWTPFVIQRERVCKKERFNLSARLHNLQKDSFWICRPLSSTRPW